MHQLLFLISVVLLLLLLSPTTPAKLHHNDRDHFSTTLRRISLTNLTYPTRLVGRWTPTLLALCPLSGDILMIDSHLLNVENLRSQNWGRLVRLSSNGSLISSLPLPTDIKFIPTAIAVDSSGNVYACSLNQQKIWKYNSANQIIAIITLSLPSNSSCAALLISPTNSIYLAEYNTGVIYEFTQSGSLLRTIEARSSSGPIQISPVGMILDAKADYLFVTDWLSAQQVGQVLMLAIPTGTIEMIYNTTDPPLKQPSSVLQDGDGNLLVMDRRNARVVKLSPTNQQLDVYDLTQGDSGAVGYGVAAVVNSTHLMASFISSSTASIKVINLQSREVTGEMNSTDAPLTFLKGIAIGSNGDIYIAATPDETRSHYVAQQVRIDGNSAVLLATFEPSYYTAEAGGVAVDSQGTVYMSSYFDNVLYQFHPNGSQTTFFVARIIYGAAGVAVDDGDYPYFCNSGHGSVLVLNPISGNVIRNYSADPLYLPMQIQIDPNLTVYIAEFDEYNNTYQIVKVNKEGTQIQRLPYHDPIFALSATPGGDIYVKAQSDTGGYCINRYSTTTGDLMHTYCLPTFEDSKENLVSWIALDDKKSILYAWDGGISEIWMFNL